MPSPQSNPNLILNPGTRVVCKIEVTNSENAVICPKGAVAAIVEAPVTPTHSYRVKLLNGNIIALKRSEFVILQDHKTDEAGLDTLADYNLWDFVIYRCITGSRAYGLDGPQSDTDTRGIYLPPAQADWSLYGVPEQLENKEHDQCFWELGKFIKLALKSNPNILECLFSPLVEHAHPIMQPLLDQRDLFLSKLAYQTYNGYVHAQFRKLEKSRANHQQPNWKHAMHLIRLLLSGITLMKEGHMLVQVGDWRDRLLTVKRGEMPWEQLDQWRLELHNTFDNAYVGCKLPERPDYHAANRLLIQARHQRLKEDPSLS